MLTDYSINPHKFPTRKADLFHTSETIIMSKYSQEAGRQGQKVKFVNVKNTIESKSRHKTIGLHWFLKS